eukprot:scaffold157808_cov40-Prasinocladus_malaysianus.AAC.2
MSRLRSLTLRLNHRLSCSVYSLQSSWRHSSLDRLSFTQMNNSLGTCVPLSQPRAAGAHGAASEPGAIPPEALRIQAGLGQSKCPSFVTQDLMIAKLGRENAVVDIAKNFSNEIAANQFDGSLISTRQRVKSYSNGPLLMSHQHYRRQNSPQFAEWFHDIYPMSENIPAGNLLDYSDEPRRCQPLHTEKQQLSCSLIST